MKKIRTLSVVIFITLSNFCMEQSQEAIYDRNYEDACGILQGTSKRGLIDAEKILEVAAALADIRTVFSEKYFSKLRSSHHLDRVLLLAENDENQTRALKILTLFPYSKQPEKLGSCELLYFKPEVDVIYLENLLKEFKFRAELDCFDRNKISVQMTKNEWSFYFKERLDFGCGTKKYCISYDPARQKITSYKRLKKCKN